ERSKGLVQEEHLRLDRERPRERHALPLTAGKLPGVPLGEAVELHEPEELVDLVADLVLWTLADLEAEGHVLAHGEVLEGRVMLEDEADPPLLRGETRRVLAEDEDVALVGLLEAGDHAEERRLAASARAEQGRQRAASNGNRDVVEGGELTEALGHPPDRYRH